MALKVVTHDKLASKLIESEAVVDVITQKKGCRVALLLPLFSDDFKILAHFRHRHALNR